MPDIWTFGPATDSSETYADSTQVPHRVWEVLLNGVAVGEMELHLHRRKGKDGVTDTSFGSTFIAYGPPQKGS